MKRVLEMCVVAVCAGAVGRTAPAPTVMAPLSELFKPGVVFQDRNADGAIDFVNAVIALPEAPAAGELAAAADVAARLGFETSAMDLPMVRLNPDSSRTEAPVIFVGANALARVGIAANAVGGAALKPGDGLVAAFTSSGQPAVAVLGGDDNGLNAAAVMVAGHLPYLWDQKGPTTDRIADEVKEFLTGKGITAASAAATAAYVRHAADLVERLVVDVQLSGAGDVVKAQVALNQFKAISGRDPKRALSYASLRELRVRLHGTGAGVATVDLPRAIVPAAPVPAALPRRSGGGAKENFDLSTFYANEGALADSDSNLIPDRVDVLLSADGDGADGAVDLAARLGLESTGVSIPIAKSPNSVDTPESEPMLVLIGTAHPVAEQLMTNHKWARPPLAPGEGLIQIVRKAFGEKSAVIVTGGDAAGVDRAVRQLAEKLPHIWARGKDRTTLDDVEDDVRKFVAGRSPAGQAAMSLYKLDKLADELRGKDLSSAHVKVFVEKAADRFADVVKQDAARSFNAASLNIEVQNLDVQKGRALVSEDVEIASEVDEFWTKLRAKVLPALKKRPTVTIEARLSEPPEIRRHIEQQARAELVKAGADERATSVTVLSAYKQGYARPGGRSRACSCPAGGCSSCIRSTRSWQKN